MAISGIGSNFSNLSISGQDRAQKLLKEMDSNEDGKVSKQEFSAFGETKKAGGPQRPARAESANAPARPSADDLFAQADSDGDGSLSIENLSAMMAQHETHAAARGGHAGNPPAGGGPPPGGGPSGGAPSGGAGANPAAGAASDSASEDSDPADTNGDGTVSASEKLMYELSHPTASDTAEA